MREQHPREAWRYRRDRARKQRSGPSVAARPQVVHAEQREAAAVAAADHAPLVDEKVHAGRPDRGGHVVGSGVVVVVPRGSPTSRPSAQSASARATEGAWLRRGQRGRRSRRAGPASSRAPASPRRAAPARRRRGPRECRDLRDDVAVERARQTRDAHGDLVDHVVEPSARRAPAKGRPVDPRTATPPMVSIICRRPIAAPAPAPGCARCAFPRSGGATLNARRVARSMIKQGERRHHDEHDLEERKERIAFAHDAWVSSAITRESAGRAESDTQGTKVHIPGARCAATSGRPTRAARCGPPARPRRGSARR